MITHVLPVRDDVLRGVEVAALGKGEISFSFTCLFSFNVGVFNGMAKFFWLPVGCAILGGLGTGWGALGLLLFFGHIQTHRLFVL